MIQFDTLKFNEDSPIYQQIVHHVKMEIAAGRAVTGDEMPSRRMLSALLGVNPNTIQKAYRHLEEEGILTSRPGAGSIICAGEASAVDIRKEQVDQELKRTIQSLRSLKITKKEAVEWFQIIWVQLEEAGEEEA